MLWRILKLIFLQDEAIAPAAVDRQAFHALCSPSVLVTVAAAVGAAAAAPSSYLTTWVWQQRHAIDAQHQPGWRQKQQQSDLAIASHSFHSSRWVRYGTRYGSRWDRQLAIAMLLEWHAAEDVGEQHSLRLDPQGRCGQWLRIAFLICLMRRNVRGSCQQCQETQTF
jgi:hypothetical protein